MKKLFTAISAMLVLQTIPNAQETAKVRIGIFDSRAVAIAYARSTFFKAKMRTLQHELKTAKEAGDTTKSPFQNELAGTIISAIIRHPWI